MATAPSIVNPADFASASTTVADVPGLSYPVKAGNRYKVRFTGTYTTSVVTTGAKLALTAPAGVVAGEWVIYGLTTTTSTRLTVTASGTAVTSADVAAIAPSEYMVTFEGYIKPSASGSVKVQYGSETAATTTLKAGSLLEVVQQ